MTDSVVELRLILIKGVVCDPGEGRGYSYSRSMAVFQRFPVARQGMISHDEPDHGEGDKAGRHQPQPTGHKQKWFSLPAREEQHNYYTQKEWCGLSVLSGKSGTLFSLKTMRTG